LTATPQGLPVSPNDSAQDGGETRLRAATTERPGLGTDLAVLAPLYGRADNPAEQPEQTVMKQPISEEAMKVGAADYLLKGEIES